ncbi:MAG: plastocyanin/azurin family copper-binding protein [Solirubrobacteraceae bacterium]
MVVGAVVLFVALSAGGGRSPATADAAGKVVKISIKNYEFSKMDITVAKGTTITWTNKDDAAHTVSATKKGGPSSKLIKKGESYSWKATKKGLYRYHCMPHLFMKARITVK